MSKASENWLRPEPREHGGMSSAEYIEERITGSRIWYENAARKAKKKYLMMKTISVVAGAAVPVVVNVIPIGYEYWMKLISSIVSLSVVILISLESIYHFREKWKNFRTTELALSKEYFEYCTKVGSYKGLTAEKALQKLVERVESALEKEASSTLNVMTTVAANEIKTQAPAVKAESDGKT